MGEFFKQIETKEEFEKIVAAAGEKPVFVDFFATWCGKCEMLLPELESIAEAHKDGAVFLKIDVEENEEVAEKYSVEALPTLICLKGGEPAGEMKGSKIDNFKKFMSENI